MNDFEYLTQELNGILDLNAAAFAKQLADEVADRAFGDDEDEDDAEPLDRDDLYFMVLTAVEDLGGPSLDEHDVQTAMERAITTMKANKERKP
jgi:hypothetical protein